MSGSVGSKHSLYPLVFFVPTFVSLAYSTYTLFQPLYLYFLESLVYCQELGIVFWPKVDQGQGQNRSIKVKVFTACKKYGQIEKNVVPKLRMQKTYFYFIHTHFLFSKCPNLGHYYNRLFFKQFFFMQGIILIKHDFINYKAFFVPRQHSLYPILFHIPYI